MPGFSSEWTGLAAALVESGRYRPLQRLGKKAGRQTLLCEDRETGQRVVIKLLSFGEDFAWQDLKLFEREAETLRSLEHPAIPKYLDYFDLETLRTKGFALVQSYIEAQSLQEQLEAGRSFSEAEIQQIGEELLGILEYLHGRQPPVIHRDIKPSNILLGDRSAHSPGQVYLVDFGSVQTLAAREGSTITVVGTYGYMPPEQFGGRAVPASDLYSLGATLIYLASGRHPADLPQKDFRIQFEDVVNLTPQSVAWLQLLIEPSLGRRALSAEKASFSCVKHFAERERTQAIFKAKGELSPKPAFSKIQASYTEKGLLKLMVPANQIALDEIDYSDICHLLAVWIYAAVIGLGIFFISFLYFHLSPPTIFSIWWGLNSSTAHSLWLILISLFVLVFGVVLKIKEKTEKLISLLLMKLLLYKRCNLEFLDVKKIITSSTELVMLIIDKRQTIQLRRPRRAIQRFTRNQFWRITRSSRLRLFLGSSELAFGGSEEELLWLEQILRKELELSEN